MKQDLNLLIGLLMVVTVAWSHDAPKHYSGNVSTLTVAENVRLEAQIAVNCINRLAVVNDRIVNIFGEEEAFTLQTDEHSGQVFIKPTEGNGSLPINITLITENGVTQDLTLIPSRTKASTIILKPVTANYTADPLLPGFSRNQSMQNQYIQIMKQAVLGELPILKTTSKQATRKVPNLQLKFNKCYQAGQLLVTVWQVTNVSRDSIELQEKQFFKTGDLALSLQRNTLPAKATTLLYVLGVS
jgi:type-F conjugative transfer system secretin TraK